MYLIVTVLLAFSIAASDTCNCSEYREALSKSRATPAFTVTCPVLTFTANIAMPVPFMIVNVSVSPASTSPPPVTLGVDTLYPLGEFSGTVTDETAL